MRPRERSPTARRLAGPQRTVKASGEVGSSTGNEHPMRHPDAPSTVLVLSGDETSHSPVDPKPHSCAQLLTRRKHGRIIRLPRERSLLAGVRPACSTPLLTSTPVHLDLSGDSDMSVALVRPSRPPTAASHRWRALALALVTTLVATLLAAVQAAPAQAAPVLLSQGGAVTASSQENGGTAAGNAVDGTAGRAGPARSPTLSGYGSTSAPRPSSAGSNSPGRPRTRRATASNSPPTAAPGRTPTAPPPPRVATRPSPSPAKPATCA